MKEHQHRTIDIPVFSARRFFSSTLETRQQDTVLYRDIPIPRRGALTVHPSGDIPGSLIFVDGLAAPSHRLHLFVDQLRHGKIPSPIVPPSPLGAGVEVYSLSPTSLALADRTLISYLGLIEPILNRIASCSRCSCASCGSSLKMFSTTARLVESMISDHLGLAIDIQLEAQSEDLLSWADVHGFPACRSDDSESVIELDSLTADSSEFQRIHKVIDLAWALPNMRVWCRRPGVSAVYAPNGFCQLCKRPAAETSRRVLRKILETGRSALNAPELLLDLGGITVGCLLSMSLSALEESSLHNLGLNPAIREDLNKLRIDEIPLGRTTSSLSTSGLTCLAAALSLILERPDDSLTVLDLPCSVLSLSEISTTTHMVQQAAKNRAILVIERKGAQFDRCLPITHDGGPKDELGRLSITGIHQAPPTEISLRRGGIHVIHPREQASFQPLASEVCTILSGRPSAILINAHYVPNHPAEPCLIDLCSTTFSATKQVLAQTFRIYEAITKLYASALDARAAGLTPKHFNLGERTKLKYLCPECHGLGITIRSYLQMERPLAHPCAVCCGTRFLEPVKDIRFRGRTIWHLLNSTFSEAAGTLRSLPKVSDLLAILRLLRLDHLPIGMPTRLLSFSERRLTAIAAGILSGTRSRPSIIVIDEPLAGLSQEQAEGLLSLLTSGQYSNFSSLLLVSRGTAADTYADSVSFI
jgi:ABC-type uncharacterized transport system ATPase subunit